MLVTFLLRFLSLLRFQLSLFTYLVRFLIRGGLSGILVVSCDYVMQHPIAITSSYFLNRVQALVIVAVCVIKVWIPIIVIITNRLGPLSAVSIG